MTDPRNAFSLDAYLADLAPLINLDCGTRTPAGVARVADILTEKYEAIGWQVVRHQFAPECGPCLEATNAPGADHYDVMLVGHMDTVFPEGTAAKRPLKVEGNQAFGPGVSDMKSGLLSTWYALKGMDPVLLAKLKVLVCCNCDEEIGSPWSRDWLVAKAKQSGCVLVAEAARPSGDLISARKGNAKYRIRFHGKASHAGSALTEGVSAITELAHWVLAINEQVNMETGTTMNVGVVQGGTGVNVVPDFAEAIVDLRFWSNDEAAAVHERLGFMANNPFLRGCQVEVDRQSFKPAMRPSGDTKALMALVEAAAADEGISFNWLEAGGGSDANFTAAAGVPSLDGLGPMGGGFHSEAEFLLLESIEPRIRLLQRVLGKLAK
ncbi:M20 family metallopeptidase [Aeromonas rivipollensis]|uniref:M20 family metallopeptidase n=1 Tax=Aeromonas rivipollensis TaxID=948519 RepID=UPI00259E9F8D|nr:M20 family metallopeptidase [Aeromonas rivipollensis]MDM5085116.1 M20 family metallopeptidase [Aeromonas rivipollensis]MDM5097187.1 M20 family metallopeptidase [Aeromonas rivipollensis]MDM5105552.1 M20 family metallopeptidase [Aeromonas rivipollensis]